MEEEEDFTTTVLTCEGDITDPAFPYKLQHLVTKLQHLISKEKPIQVTNVEPWNSVRVTFNIPNEAAQRLRQLAEQGDSVLRELGILSVQIEDQVITLTLAGQFNEPQEIVLRKTSDSQDGVGVPNVSFNLPSSESVPGPSTAEPAHKNISQFLGHIVGGAAASAAPISSPALPERLDAAKKEPAVGFRSPNVVAPSSTEPLPFVPRAAAAANLAPTGVLRTPSGSGVLGKKPSFGPFPFASMTHAMNTKQRNLGPRYQSVVNVRNTHPHLLLTTTSIHNALTNSSVQSVSVTKPQTVLSSSLQKGSPPVSHSVFNNVVSRVSSANSVVQVSRANVALTSPLLVNLLQSETSNIQGHNKLMPPPTLIVNQGPKRKRKSRKGKDKASEDAADSASKMSAVPSPPQSNSPNSANQPFSVPLSSISQSTSSASYHQITKAKSSMQLQSASIHPQAQGQPPVSMHVQFQGQPPVSKRHHVQGSRAISTIRQPAPVPNIHPQAQGQPQVHTGNLPLHSHIPVGSPQLARPPTSSVQTYGLSASHSLAASNPRLVLTTKDRTSVISTADKLGKAGSDVKSGDKRNTTTVSHDSTPDPNPFPSPPSSGDGKTKHLINPFTGQLEPMPSDEEDEDESIGSLPPFPEFEIDTSENGQSEKSLSDGGKDNNLSSDTDSGIGKSQTDVSQSSTECGPSEPGQEDKKLESASSKSEASQNTMVTSSVPLEKLKLRLKLDHKTIRESKEAEAKEKKKDCASQVGQKIDVAVVNIPSVKKGSSLGSAPAEPRVPPLHISLRGPNAAVVVSPRKDDAKSRFASAKDDHQTEAVPKATQRKVRSPRNSKSSESSGTQDPISSRMLDSLDKKAKCSGSSSKRSKEDYWNQNVKNMSGGGIVEMSDKLSSVHCYETYLTDLSLGASMPKKGSPLVQNSCKSEVITLTSCATGESVSIHASGNSESTLPFHVVVGAEASSALVTGPQVSSSAEKVLKSKHMSTKNHMKDVPSTDKLGIDSRSKKDSSVAPTPRRSQQYMQKSSLPHSSGGNDGRKVVVSEAASAPCDQVQPTSANCVPLVPPSSHVTHVGATESCATSVVTSISDHVVSVSSDAKKLSPGDKANSAKLSANATNATTNSADSQSHNQCNISSASVCPDVPVSSSSDLLKTPNESAFSNSVSEKVCSNSDSVDNTNEVQNKTAVNTEKTANHFDTNNSLSDSADLGKNSLEKPKVSSESCKNAVFSTFIERCRSPLTNFVSVSKREIIKEVVGASEKGLRIIEVKKPPIAQIITVDSSPIQSHVIEVPSLALPETLVKSDLALEIGSIPSLIPSDKADAFAINRSQSVTQDSGREISQNPMELNKPDETDNLLSFQGSSCTAGSSVFGSDLSKEDAKPEDDAAERNSSTVASEESSMDSIDEERKKCMLTSEVKTSTPGPPPSDNKMLKPSSSDLSATEDTKHISLGSLSPTNIEKCQGESNSTEKDTQALPEDMDATGSAHSSGDVQSASSPKSVTFPESSTASKLEESDNPKPEKVALLSISGKVLTESALNLCSKGISLSNQPQTTDSLPCNKMVPLALEVQNVPTTSDPPGESQSRPPSASQSKPSSPCEPPATTTLCSSSSLALASYIPHGRFPSPDANPSGRVRLIFKGAAPHSVLSTCSSPASFVLPLNSSKTVPIKLVTLPGGAAGLSVRSTSNPNVVEIVGPNTPVTHVPSTGNIHRSSPVRLVVSKVSPNVAVASASQGSVASARGRVVVKSVMVSGAPSSLKLSPAKTDLCSTLPISNASSVIAATLAGKITSSVPDSASTAPKQNEKLESVSTVPVTVVEKIETAQTIQTLDLKASVSPVRQIEPDSVATGPLPVSKVPETSLPSPSPSTTVSASAEIEPLKTVVDSGLEEEELPVKCLDIEENSTDPLLVGDVKESCSAVNYIDAESLQPDHSSEDVVTKDDCFLSDNISEVYDMQDEISKSVPLDDQSCQDSKCIINDADSPQFPGYLNDEENVNLNSVSDLSSILLSSDSLQEQPYLVAKEVTVESDVSVSNDRNCSPEYSDVIQKCNTDCYEEVLLEQAFLFNSLENDMCLSPKLISPENEELDKVEQPLIRPKVDDDTSQKFDDACESEESVLVAHDSDRNQLAISLVYPKPVKRKCSENAAELIKACMGVEEAPKRGILFVPEVESGEKPKCEKLEEDVRINSRVKRENSTRKMRGLLYSDCSSDEELTLNELMAKSRMRERPARSGLGVNRDTPTEAVNSRPGRRRSGSNESIKSEDMKTRSKDAKRDVKKEESIKKLPERTKRGVNKGQAVQRGVFNADSEVKPTSLNTREEPSVKRKTRSTGIAETAEATPVKRRRYSKDGHR